MCTYGLDGATAGSTGKFRLPQLGCLGRFGAWLKD